MTPCSKNMTTFIFKCYDSFLIIFNKIFPKFIADFLLNYFSLIFKIFLT